MMGMTRVTAIFGYLETVHKLVCNGFLRLDNTGAWVIEVYSSLLCNQMSKNVDIYIKWKLGMFSVI